MEHATSQGQSDTGRPPPDAAHARAASGTTSPCRGWSPSSASPCCASSSPRRRSRATGSTSGCSGSSISITAVPYAIGVARVVGALIDREPSRRQHAGGSWRAASFLAPYLYIAWAGQDAVVPHRGLRGPRRAHGDLRRQRRRGRPPQGPRRPHPTRSSPPVPEPSAASGSAGPSRIRRWSVAPATSLVEVLGEAVRLDDLRGQRLQVPQPELGVVAVRPRPWPWWTWPS